MSFKVAFIGAGSIGFTRGLLRDLLLYRSLNIWKLHSQILIRRIWIW